MFLNQTTQSETIGRPARAFVALVSAWLILTNSPAAIAEETKTTAVNGNASDSHARAISLNNEGVRNLKCNFYKEAIENFREAMSLDQSYEMAPMNLAISYHEYGLHLFAKPEVGIGQLSRSLMLAPNNRTTWNNFYHFIKLLQGKEALSETLPRLAKTAYEQNDYVTAFVEYSQAYSFHRSSEIYARLEDAYEKIKSGNESLLLMGRSEKELVALLSQQNPQVPGERFETQQTPQARPVDGQTPQTKFSFPNVAQIIRTSADPPGMLRGGPRLLVQLPDGDATLAQVINLNNNAVRALHDKDYESAIQKLRAAMLLDPSYQLAPDNLKIAYTWYSGSVLYEPNFALRQIMRALLLFPNDGWTQVGTAFVLKKLHRDPQKYEDLLAQAQSLSNSSDDTAAFVAYALANGIQPSQELSKSLSEAYQKIESGEDKLLLRERSEQALVSMLSTKLPKEPTNIFQEPGYMRVPHKPLKRPPTVIHAPNVSPAPAPRINRDAPMPVVKEPAFDVKEYQHQVMEMVLDAWNPPESEEATAAIATFTVDRFGAPHDIKVKESSGSTAADEAAIKAIRNASPFPMLPAGVSDQNFELPFAYVGAGHHGSEDTKIKFGIPPISQLRDLETARLLGLACERKRKFDQAEAVYEKMSLVAASELNIRPSGTALIESDLSRVKAIRHLIAGAKNIELESAQSPAVASWISYAEKLLSTVEDSARVDDAVKLVYFQYVYDRSALPPFKSAPDAAHATATARRLLEQYDSRNVARHKAELLDLAASESESHDHFVNAYELYRQEQDSLKRLLGENAPEAIAIGGDLARVYEDQGAYAQAQTEFEKALAAFKKLQNPGILYARMLEDYADLLGRMKQNKKSEAVAEEARNLFKNQAGGVP